MPTSKSFRVCRTKGSWKYWRKPPLECGTSESSGCPLLWFLASVRMAVCPLECSLNAFQKHTTALYYIVFAHKFQSQLETSSPAAGYSGKPAGRQVLRLHREGCLGPTKDRPQALCTLHWTSETRTGGFSLLLIPLEEITSDRLSLSVSRTCVLSETGFRFTLSEAWRKFWFFPYLQREQGAHWPA